MENINSKVEKATVWSSVTEIVAKIITPVVNMILARLLVPEAFGLVATITMVISFAEIFTDAGFQKYIIQHEFENEAELDRSTDVAFWTNLALSAVICVIIFIFRNFIAKTVGSPELGNSISIASILIIIAAFSSLQMSRYKRSFDFKTLFYVRIGTSLIPLLVTIPLAITLKNYWAILIGTFSSNLFTAIVLTVKSKWRPHLFYSFKLLKEMLSFSIWTLFESISIWLTSYIGVFIVGNYLNDYYLGLYKTTMSTVNGCIAIITSALTPVLFSALSRYQNDDEAFQKTYYSFQRLSAIFVIPLGIGIYLFRDLVTLILLGGQWTEASDFVGWWALTSAFVIVFSYFSSEVYRSKGNPKLSLLTQLIHLAFLVPTLIISVKYSFSTLCISRSLVRVQGILSALIVMRIVYKFKIKDTLKNVAPMMISALIMGGVGYLLKLVSDAVVWQIFAVLLCIAVYFATLFILFPKTRRELLDIGIIQKLKNRILHKAT